MKFTSLFIVFIALALGACKEQKQLSSTAQTTKIERAYPETILPQDTSKLWVSAGDPAKDIVLILLQGGPKDQLGFAKHGRTTWRYLPDYDQYYRVHLHQATTYNTKIFEYEKEFSLDMAKLEVDNTSEMLYRAIQYFKSRNKTVYVMGHSYGAFIIPHYLATRPSLADKYVVISGRITDNSVALAAHKKGYNGIYINDGTTFKADNLSHLDDYTVDEEKYYRVKQWLKWAIGLPNYSEELVDVDLSQLTYIYYPNDERVGRLTEQEIKFLESKKASVFSTTHEHGYSIRALVDLVVAGEIQL